MSQAATLERLRGVLQQSLHDQPDLDLSAIDLQTSIEDLGFDSLTMLDLIYDLQQEFQFDDDVRELAGLKTVGDLVAYLETREPA